MSIPIKSLAAIAKKYADIQRIAAGVTVSIEPNNFWNGTSQEWHLAPRFGGVKDIPALAAICETTGWYLPWASVDATSSSSTIRDMRVTGAAVNQKHTGLTNGSVKYYYETAKNFTSLGFGLVVPWLITEAPVETNAGGRNFRTVKAEALITYGDGYARNTTSASSCYYTVSTDSPYYDFLDAGHILFFTSRVGEDPQVFVANQLSLAVYNFAAIFSVAAEKVRPLLRNNAFLFANNSAELQRVIGLAERELPTALATNYTTLRANIRKDFENNAQGALVTKFQRGELKEISLNEVKFNTTRATYETVTITAPDLSKRVLAALDPSAVFDIYGVVDAYIASILKELETRPRHATLKGYAQAFEYPVNINGIQVTVALSTTNTRTKVNGHYINSDELARVIRRASCFQDAAAYEQFLTQIERASLRVHDACGNGVPVKILALANSKDYSSPVTSKHPKVFFNCEESRFFLWVNKDRTQKVQIRRFVEMLDKVKAMNTKTDNERVIVKAKPATTEASATPRTNDTEFGQTHRNVEWAKGKLKSILLEHAVDADDKPLITTEQMTSLIEWLLEARTEAERKSKQLLDSIVKETGATATQYQGREAYNITGASGRVYTVEKENFKVWDSKTGNYVCIVDGKGEMGVGYDALVARLLALKNDTFVVDRINTLRGVAVAA